MQTLPTGFCPPRRWYATHASLLLLFPPTVSLLLSERQPIPGSQTGCPQQGHPISAWHRVQGTSCSPFQTRSPSPMVRNLEGGVRQCGLLGLPPGTALAPLPPPPLCPHQNGSQFLRLPSLGLELHSQSEPSCSTVSSAPSLCPFDRQHRRDTESPRDTAQDLQWPGCWQSGLSPQNVAPTGPLLFVETRS